jgi:two-component system cell cycle sensor histidine kinase PleC
VTQQPPIDEARDSSVNGASLWRRLIGAFLRRPLSRRIVVATVLLLLGLHAGNAVLVFHFYRTNAAREQEAREARATLLAEHASRAFSAVDLSLETIVDKLSQNLRLATPSVFIQLLLDDRIRRLPQIRALLVLDENGTVVYDSRLFPAVQRDLSDRPYFSEQKKWRGVGLYIGSTVRGRWDNKPFFGMSRPLLDSDGNFRGIVVALAEPTYFSSFYGARELEPRETALLARDDGAVLAGSESASDERHVGATVAGILGASARQAIIRPVPSFPLKMVITGPSPAASPALRSFLVADGGVMLAMTIVALWLARILAREAEARETAEGRLRDAIENAPDAFALFDGNDRLVLCNELYRTYIPPPIRHLLVPGLSFEALLRGLVTVGHRRDPEVDETPEDYFNYRLAMHRAGGVELVQRLHTGNWVLSRERRTGEGGIVCFHTDITNMKHQEEALRRSEQAERLAREHAEKADHAKSTFLATMSHELRTPLNAVIGFSEIIERQLFGDQNARYREYGALIRRSGQHLLAIINDILDIAKLQSGKTELHLEITDVGQVIEEILNLIANQAEAGELELVARVEDDVPPIRVDPIRLRQILLNLLSNAIKFTPKGGRVSIEARSWEGSVRIDVSDSGIGMAEKDIPKALEPFGQISNALTRAHEGTGLGLPLSKRLVELHGGHFAIASAPDAGTTVTIVFPANLTAIRGVETMDELAVAASGRRSVG